MEPTEVSLMILRHLAREGCSDTIKTYLQECPPVRQALLGRNVGNTDVETYRNNLLGCSVNLTLIDLLTDYARAKSMIQDLVRKVVNEWKALPGVYLSPQDSMTTQLAHINDLLQLKYSRRQVESKSVDTSDLQPIATISSCKTGVDVTTQVNEEAWKAPAGDGQTESELVTSLLNAPVVVDKLVELANKEMNKSTNSTDHGAAEDTDARIDAMLWDILNGLGPLGTDQGHPDTTFASTLDVESRLNTMLDDAQDIIVDTPVAGTLCRPDDSAMKKKPCNGFLDLMETPYKQIFTTSGNTPLSTPLPEQRSNVKTVELYGSASTSKTWNAAQISEVIEARKNAMAQQPRFTVTEPTSSISTRKRRFRSIMPKVPEQASSSRSSGSDSVHKAISCVQGSASKRKFNTPMKWTPSKTIDTHLNFYCPTNSTHKDYHRRTSDFDRTLEPSPPRRLPETKSLDLSAANNKNSSLTTPTKEGAAEPQLVASSTPLPITLASARVERGMVTEVDQDQEGGKEETVFVNEDQQQIATDEQQHELLQASASTRADNYSRLLESVRNNRPTAAHIQKKSFSTPRKRHIRNLLFKTPPSGQDGSNVGAYCTNRKTEKRRLSPLRGSKSKKRLKFLRPAGTSLATTEEADDLELDVVNVTSPGSSNMKIVDPEITPIHETPAKDAEKSDSQMVQHGRSVHTRSKTAKKQGSNKPVREEDKTQTAKLSNEKSNLKAIETLSPKETPAKKKNSPMARKYKQPDLVAAEKASIDAVPLGGKTPSLPATQRLTRGKRLSMLKMQMLSQGTSTACLPSSPALLKTQTGNISVGTMNFASFNSSADSETAYNQSFSTSGTTSSTSDSPESSFNQSGRSLSLKTPDLRVKQLDKLTSSNPRPTPIIASKVLPVKGKTLSQTLFGNLSDSDADSSCPNSPVAQPVTTRSKWQLKVKSPEKPKAPVKPLLGGGKKTPRRILPQPVPSDYPPAVFPPTPENQGYILSIPSNTNTPRHNESDEILIVEDESANIFSSLNNVPVVRQDSKTNVDASSILSIPKTPRIKLDSDDTSTHTRFFSVNSFQGYTNAFEVTPSKFGIPETPGKNISLLNKTSHQENSQSSLFDTPMKDLPQMSFAGVASAVPQNVKLDTVMKVPVRKSPRKHKTAASSSHAASRKPTFTKTMSSESCSANPPLVFAESTSTSGSAVKWSVKDVIHSSTNRIPACGGSASNAKKIENNDPIRTAFPNWSKSRKLSILSATARALQEQEAKSEKSSSKMKSPKKDVSRARKSSKTSKKVAKEDVPLSSTADGRNMEIQFDAGGKTKTLSMSEHESLLGLLQMSSFNVPSKKQSSVTSSPSMPLKNTQSQVPPANVLQTFNPSDVQDFLKSLHGTSKR